MNTGCFAVAALATLAYGAQAVELVSGDGCRVVVEAYGGRLVSWQPKDAGEVRKCSISGTDGMRYFCKAEAGLGDKRVWGGDFPCSVPYEKGVGYVLEEKSPEGKHGHVLGQRSP